MFDFQINKCCFYTNVLRSLNRVGKTKTPKTIKNFKRLSGEEQKKMIADDIGPAYYLEDES